MKRESTTGAVAANTDCFICATGNGFTAANNKLYKGTLTSAVAEVTYAVTTDSSGALTSEAAENGIIGNYEFFSFAIVGTISWVGVWNRELSSGEIRAQQFRPHKTTGNLLFMHLGWAGTGTQADLSGNGNNGTVTGATRADHLPIARWP